MSPQELLKAEGLYLESYAPGRRYNICSHCSQLRTGAAHQQAKVLGVTIENDDSARWGCNHCGWTGPESTGKSNGQGGEFAATYDYYDASCTLRIQKMRNLPGSKIPLLMRRPHS